MDTFLRDLERSWEAGLDPAVGLRLILAKFRAGQEVDLDAFPLELWHKIATDFSIENIAHHLALGGRRLDQQLSAWALFVDSLPHLGASHFKHLVGNIFAYDNLMIISRAATRQKCKTSVVYYPTLPMDKRVAVYINMILSTETLSEADIQAMREDDPIEGVTHWGLVMKAFFNPRISIAPQQLAMTALIDVYPNEPDPQNYAIKILNNVSAVYDMPVEPPRDDLGYRVPFLVLKELS